MIEFILFNFFAILLGVVVGVILGKFLYEEPPWSAS